MLSVQFLELTEKDFEIVFCYRRPYRPLREPSKGFPYLLPKRADEAAVSLQPALFPLAVESHQPAQSAQW